MPVRDTRDDSLHERSPSTSSENGVVKIMIGHKVHEKGSGTLGALVIDP